MFFKNPPLVFNFNCNLSDYEPAGNGTGKTVGVPDWLDISDLDYVNITGHEDDHKDRLIFCLIKVESNERLLF